MDSTSILKLWSPKSGYLKVKDIIKAIPVGNGLSEQALDLLTEFHNKLTCNLTAKQNIFKTRWELAE